jgi:preprotein translocase subunit SecA
LDRFFPGASVGDLSEDVNKAFTTKMEEMESAAKATGRPAVILARSANYITLVTMDNAWNDHVQNMENLKEAVILRQFKY